MFHCATQQITDHDVVTPFLSRLQYVHPHFPLQQCVKHFTAAYSRSPNTASVPTSVLLNQQQQGKRWVDFDCSNLAAKMEEMLN